MNILRVVTLVSATGKYGGPSATALRQARIAAWDGNTSVLLAGALPGDSPDWNDDQVRLRIVRVNFLWRIGFTGVFSTAALRAIIRSARGADVVHVSFCRELIPIVAVIVARLLRKPLVLQPHGMLTARSSRLHRAVDPVARLAAGRKAHWIALTSVEEERLREWGRGRVADVSVLGNPVAPRDEGRRVPSESQVLFAARLHRRKNVKLFLDAARVADDRGWNDRYVIAGPDEGDLGHVVARAAHQGNVSYAGALSEEDLSVLLDSSDVFALTSHDEPWGNVLVTALSREKPVVVTESTHLAESIEACRAGIVLAEDPAAFADAIHRLLTDRDFQSGFSAGARRFTAKYLDPLVQQDRLLDVYRRVTTEQVVTREPDSQ